MQTGARQWSKASASPVRRAPSRSESRKRGRPYSRSIWTEVEKWIVNCPNCARIVAATKRRWRGAWTSRGAQASRACDCRRTAVMRRLGFPSPGGPCRRSPSCGGAGPRGRCPRRASIPGSSASCRRTPRSQADIEWFHNAIPFAGRASASRSWCWPCSPIVVFRFNERANPVPSRSDPQRPARDRLDRYARRSILVVIAVPSFRLLTAAARHSGAGHDAEGDGLAVALELQLSEDRTAASRSIR